MLLTNIVCNKCNFIYQVKVFCLFESYAHNQSNIPNKCMLFWVWFQ